MQIAKNPGSTSLLHEIWGLVFHLGTEVLFLWFLIFIQGFVADYKIQCSEEKSTCFPHQSAPGPQCSTLGH